MLQQCETVQHEGQSYLEGCEGSAGMFTAAHPARAVGSHAFLTLSYISLLRKSFTKLIISWCLQMTMMKMGMLMERRRGNPRHLI